MIRDLEFRESLQVSILSERRVYHPYGLNNGKCGARGLNLWIRKEGDGNSRVLNLGGKNTVKVNAGDRIVICTPGGGGWGAPVYAHSEMDDAVKRFL